MPSTTLTKYQIEKLQKLYTEHFGVTLDEGEALEKGLHLVSLVECIYGVKSKDGHTSPTIREGV